MGKGVSYACHVFFLVFLVSGLWFRRFVGLGSGEDAAATADSDDDDFAIDGDGERVRAGISLSMGNQCQRDHCGTGGYLRSYSYRGDGCYYCSYFCPHNVAARCHTEHLLT